MRWILPLTLLACGTSHLPANPLLPKPYSELVWQDDFDASVEQGLSEDKPVLLILAAGPMEGFT